ncbi:glycine--tRNA ligase subunit beta [Proteocatella sphenisci]|uniref:glycine--tRNA ligase subunit beta n=1 Tax=Proteocatella sphenisci TaxID=181070 RepID=UPI00048EBBFD|nr:glycine--tRNA ligase subunit beta [Proteocatella sphenisci]
MNRDLFYEIGTEEIPARYINNALKEMKDILSKNLNDLNVQFDEIEIKATPRRFAILVKNIDEKQRDLKEEYKGPAKKIAYDTEGNPTKALTGFVKGKKGSIENVELRKVGDDEYIFLNVEKPGKETILFVKEILENVVRGVNFPKPMRWGGKNLKFIRPIRWFMCVYYGKHQSFDIEGIKTTNITKGHRFLCNEDFVITDFEDYKQKLRDNFVILDQDERRQMILEQVKAVAKTLNGVAVIDEKILEEVNFIVEYPTAFYGSYAKEYLELPEEVIITPMESHQRYFPVRDKSGKLMNYFITVRNGNDYMIENVRKGNERVLVARLMDAKFFYEEDTKKTLESFVSGLDTIVFQKKLGTMRNKVDRIAKSALMLAEVLKIDKTHISRAALLSKADLTTAMVFEFPELQGIMGRYYSILDKENPIVSEAIYEHYLPRNANDSLPQTKEGTLLSIADKMDSIAGFFSIGIQPTGSQDPYALRRQAIGIIHILMNNDFDIRLRDVFEISLSQFETLDKSKTMTEMAEFFKQRLNNLMLDMGIKYDVINSVIDNENISLHELIKIARDVELWLKEDRSESISTIIRVQNILKSQEYTGVNADLFVNESESELYEKCNDIKVEINSALNSRNYITAIKFYEALTPYINSMFDAVMIMDEDMDVRNNRLNLLNLANEMIENIIDVSKINYK